MALVKRIRVKANSNLGLIAKLRQQYKDGINSIKCSNVSFLKLIAIILKPLKCTFWRKRNLTLKKTWQRTGTKKRTLEGFKVTWSKFEYSKEIQSFGKERSYNSIWSNEKCEYFQKVVLWISKRPPRKTAKGTQ